MSDGTDEIVKEFLVESYENLDQLDRDLVVLEEDPTNRHILSSVFRTIHTIKGTCGFLGFSKLEAIAHVGESLLSRLRDGQLTLDTEKTSGLLAMVDAVREILANIESRAEEGEGDYTELIALLTRLQPTEESAAAPEPVVPEAVATADDAVEPAAVETAAPEAEPAPEVELPSEPEPAFAEEAAPEPEPAAEPSFAAPSAHDSEPAGAAHPESGEARATARTDTTIRVDVGLLDKLMNLAGELVLARNQILQFAVTQKDTSFVATTQRLNLITTELQEGVMKTRMQPIKNVWSKFPRVVRDLAVACGKHVRIDMEGEETELDKTILEAIKDPLTHIVRNSVDHGVESPADRVAKGKPAEGRLLLRAFHEGGHVNIEIADDGAGISVERVRQKALARNLVTAEQAARMGDRELLNLIFLPGFSTAEKVTNVSGRGVGMDVVKTNIEKIGGSVDVHSTPGNGTTLKIKIPLTLAIIPALIVTSSGERYAIPQVSLLELVRLEGEQARKGVEVIHGAPVYRLRGNLLPLVYLNRALDDANADAAAADHINIVVLQADDQQFGLVVEGINDTEEIVVKPLSKQLKGVTTFAGATIMGDGRVALILDVMGLAQRGRVVAEVRETRLGEKAHSQAERSGTRDTLLLFSIGDDVRMAISLGMVARLEEFPRAEVERSGGQEVVQYRGQIMPLVRLSRILTPGTPDPTDDRAVLQVIVYTKDGRSVGLVVDRILDIVEADLTVQRDVGRDGVLGSAVIQQKVTDLLDVQDVVRRSDPTFQQNAAA
jgi:two-component system, chemotaxis family, sensor kinase CheA